MSQDDENSNYKTKPKNNNHYCQQQQHDNHYSNQNNTNSGPKTMKYSHEHKPTATDGSALTESFSSNDIHNNKCTSLALERQQNKSAPFNNEFRVVATTTTTNGDHSSATPRILPDYENINFNSNLTLDKRVLLQKYFRSALVGPRTNIYENLCRGCNYGVFTARGPLCSFCECIVNGVKSISASPAESSNNIYENICENCAQFYSGNEEDCQCRKKKELIVSFRETEEAPEPKQSNKKTIVLKKVGSEDCLIEAKEEPTTKVKIRKTKSFNKTNKPKILSNIWGTLRKHKTPTPPKKKPLEIVHNVEGYDQVYHTNETFDLQRMCELKRSVTSCSDQHIYGRLKQRELVRSQEDFLSTQSLVQQHESAGAKRPRISKAKFLRSFSTHAGTEETPLTKENQPSSTTNLGQSVFLNNSVCNWMTSLRHESNAPYVNTCFLSSTDEAADFLCYPKSIPAKNWLNLPSLCKAPPLSSHLVTNALNIFKNNVTTSSSSTLSISPTTTLSSTSSLSSAKKKRRKESTTDTDSLDSPEIVTLRRHNQYFTTTNTALDTSLDSFEAQRATATQEQQYFLPKDQYRQMVDEFKLHLLNKQAKQHKQHQHRHLNNERFLNKTMASAGVNDKNKQQVACSNNGSNNNNATANNEIPLRQAISNHNKAKRQGMYLRLDEQHNLTNNIEQQQHLELTKRRQERPRKVLNTDDHNNNIKQRAHSNQELSSSHKKSSEQTLSTVTTSNSNLDSHVVPESEECISRACVSRALDKDKITPCKRSGIHENQLLQAFEDLLKHEQHLTTQTNDAETDPKESQSKDNQKTTTTAIGDLELLTFGSFPNKQTLQPYSNNWSPVIDVLQLIKQLQLASSLNTAVIRYDATDKHLFVFLRYISQNGEKYKHATQQQLVRKYQRFHNKYCSDTLYSTTPKTSRATLNHSASESTTTASTTTSSVDLKLDLMKSNGNIYGRIKISQSEKINDSLEAVKTVAVLKEDSNRENTANELTTVSVQNSNKLKTKKPPPEVPKRDPSTKLSPVSEQLPAIPVQRSASSPTKMTVPTDNLIRKTNSEKSHKTEESIYQPIWKCKTVGEVQERFKTDEDYYTLKELQAIDCSMTQKPQSTAGEVPEILISEEDHSEWEPDEEFVFATELATKAEPEGALQDPNATMRSNRSQDSSIGSMSLSGSTITDFASSTATLASCVSTSLMHHLFRNIGVFYSLTEPKLRAIIYDYDRVHSWKYFAKSKPLNNNAVMEAACNASAVDDINDSGLGISPTPSALSHKRKLKSQQHQRSPVAMQRLLYRENSPKCSESVAETLPEAKVATGVGNKPSNSIASSAGSAAQFTTPDSVQAWKLQLLNVNYMEDEEDMIVSKSEIELAQKIKDDVDHQPEKPQQFLQRFKSRSTDNILDLPIEDEKKTISERVRNKLQRGILNINTRSSPKSEKKLNKALRKSQTTSLYLEDGLKPKQPIFGAPLDQLELNRTTCPNVPRFVVDSIEFIERKDRIVQDGLYRACGNKFFIDDLKQKLTTSYIYDPKLIASDDIHTIASLLKQFFRDLPHPLIPQDTYNSLAKHLLTINDGIDTFRSTINEMSEPNKSTLGFLIKHLTNVAACSSSNRMNASNLAIVWGPSLFTLNEAKTFDIGRMNTITKVLIENYDRIFHTNERLL